MDNTKNISVVIVVHNEKSELEICLDSIRKFSDVKDLQVIIIDNASNDGTKEWLASQKDIAYATMDIKNENYANVLNDAIKLFGLDGDIIFMRSWYAIIPGCISGMRDAAYSEQYIGASGPLIDGNNYFETGSDEVNIESFIEQPYKNKLFSTKKVIGLSENIVYIKGEIRKKVGKFDEQFKSNERMMKDYFLRILNAGYLMNCNISTSVICTNPYLNEAIEEQMLFDVKEGVLLKNKWGMKYFNTLFNLMVIDMIIHKADDVFEVLEVGCDCGATLLEIKNKFHNAAVYGYEINPSAAQIASHVAEVEVGNIEEQAFNYEKCKFDYIIFGDVLEHLRDPAKTIKYCKDYLKDDGRIIASIPNLMHISVIRDLLSGNFTYHNIGLLDNTHIHMFTYNEMIRMFNNSGFEVEDTCSRIISITEDDKEYINRLLEFEPSAKRFMYETYQFNIRVKKISKRVIVIKNNIPILNYIADHIIREYKELNYSVFEIYIDDVIKQETEFINILEQGVEKAFVLNNRGLLLKYNEQNIWDLFQVECINYLLDHPYHYFDTLESAPSNATVACVDRNHVNYINRFYKHAYKSIFLPLAGEEIKGNKEKLRNRSIDILFVGTYKKREEYLQLTEFQKNIIQKLINNPYKTLEEVIENDYKEQYLSMDDTIIKTLIEENRIIDMYMKFYYRNKVVKTLVEAGIDVEVYGTGWEEAEYYSNPHFIHQGTLSQEECLNKMLDTKIVLNVMPWFKDGIHDRVLNAMFAGAVCITDDSQYLKEEFEADKEYVSFTLEQIDNLPKIVYKLLNDLDYAQCIVDNASKKIFNKHSWSDRIKMIES